MEINIEKQVDYWRSGSEEDLRAAHILLKEGQVRHGLFFTHLALEKILKALICMKIRDVPPRIHDLIRLATISGIILSEEQIELLSDINIFNLEGRYPEFFAPLPSPNKANELHQRTVELHQWLVNQF